jgi:hypothetical protein
MERKEVILKDKRGQQKEKQSERAARQNKLKNSQILGENDK